MVSQQADRNYLAGVGLALVATVALSISGALVKLGLGQADAPVALLFMRFVVASAAFWVVLPLVSPRALQVNRSTLLSCAGVALANTTSLTCFYLASARLPASVVLIIHSLYPVVAILMLALRGERITWVSAARLVLASVGVLLLVESGKWNDPLGLVLAFGVPVGYALHLALAQWKLGHVSAQTVSLYTVSIMTGMMGVIYLVQFRGGWQPLSRTGWWVVLVTGLVSTALARLTNFAAIRRIGSGQVALLGPLGNLMSVVWALILVGERLSSLQWVGALLILLSAAQVVQPNNNERDGADEG